MYSVEPADIVKVTGGLVTIADLRNWVRQKLFNPRLPIARAGKPRRFPQQAVYEAALLAQFSNHGCPLPLAKTFNKQILQHLDANGHVSKFGGGKGSSPVNLVAFSPPTKQIQFISAPRNAAAVMIFEHLFGLKRGSETYNTNEIAIALINVAGLIDNLDRAFDTERFAPRSAE